MNNFIKYCKDSWEELAHKTTWPSSQELTHSAVVVLIASIIIAVLVFAIDKVFQFVMMSIYPN
jgi:preprotein translocase subunit SecE